jgi:hypothetical protein
MRMNDEQREAIKAVAKAVVVAWGHIKESLMALAKKFACTCRSIYQLRMKHIAAKQKTKSSHQSWIVKQDTRRLSQVMNNKPKVHMPRILY